MKKIFSPFLLLCAVGPVAALGASGPADSLGNRPAKEMPGVDTTGIAVADGEMVLDDHARGFGRPVEERTIYELRLDSIEKHVPLDYNEFVRSHIELYVYKRKGMVSRMMGLSEYYFPIFERALKERGLPLELKYLSIVESALNPNAVSRVGATGLWQFMYTTAREYGLRMNSYVDERRDPVAASRAAAEYLNNMYGRYGDWLLAIASYNCGSGNVDRAIYKAGGKLDFWAIRPYLPQETRNYVPAYIAVTYIMNWAEQYDIYPDAPVFAFKTTPVQVEKRLSLSHLSRELDVDMNQLCLLNPKYKRRIVNGSGANPQTVWIPEEKQELWAGLSQAGGKPEAVAVSAGGKQKPSEPVHYRVKSGDNLTSIANRFNCTVQDLKVWNDLRTTRLVPGQRLVIEPEEGEASPQPARKYLAKTYKVKRGDTLSGIAERFNTSVTLLKELNGIRNSTSLRAGKVIRISPEG